MYEVMWFVLNVELYILRVEYMYMYDTLHVLHVVHILRVTCTVLCILQHLIYIFNNL